ncbi:MAG: phage holin family protein [Gammaproteobacteria bacterium]|nr:phage holin family protein [Gammaproteobacteria bacterium]
MISMLIIWLATFVGLGISALILLGINSKKFISLVIAAAVLGLINTFIRPVLWMLTAPLSLLTFGLFVLVINALMIMLAAAMVPGFEVRGFGSALLAAIIMAVIGIIAFVAVALLTGADISFYSVEYYSRAIH